MSSVVARVLPTALLIVTLLAGVAGGQAPFAPSGTTYRVFLVTGEPLPSYGEPAFVGDRVIFNLLLGPSSDSPDVRLVSLPTTGVDTERTTRYIHAMRAAHYAATRGEADFAALTAEVARVLDELTTATDGRRKLALATNARRALLAWATDHYEYRAADIRELAGLFDDVIVELRVAVGEPGVSFELVAPPAPLEALLPEPSQREVVALALAAVDAADVGADRVEILKRTQDVAQAMGDAAVTRTVTSALAGEVKVGTAYSALFAAMQGRADAARRRGDVGAVQRLEAEVDRQDRALGARRPAEVQAFKEQLSAVVESTREFRRALDAHTRQLGSLRRYDQQVQPLLLRFQQLRAPLTTLRDMRGITPAQLALLDADVQRLVRDLGAVRPPAAQLGIHATFQSVLRFAQEACARRRQATSSQSSEMREASAAASGALLLGAQVRTDLATSLRRPTIQ